MSDDEDQETVPATVLEMAAALKSGDIDALVELANTLQEAMPTNTEMVEAILALTFTLLPAKARKKILADGAKAHSNIIDLFTRKPR